MLGIIVARLMLAAASVDPEVVELESCRISALSFRNQSEGWAFDLCSHVFHTRNAGISWEVAHGADSPVLGSNFFTDLHWLDDKVGLAFTNDNDAVSRTEDGGRSWSITPLPLKSGQWFYSVDHYGPRVWACGSSGTLIRSDDAGRHWTRLSMAPTEAMNGGGDKRYGRCMSLSFISPDDGWLAAGASLWRTVDGGWNWVQLPTPKPMEWREYSGFPLRKVVRASAEVAWLSGKAGNWVTHDGGKSWEGAKSATSEFRPEPARFDPQRPAVVSQREPGAAVVPLMSEATERYGPWGEGGVVTLDGAFFAGGLLVRSSPLLTAGSGKRVPLAGQLAIGARTIVGWASTDVFQSDDSGVTFYRIGRLSSLVDRVVAPTEVELLARTKAGSLYRQGRGGPWKVTTTPTDLRDWMRAVGQKPPRLMDCVVQAKTWIVELRFGVAGCFGGSESSLALRNDGSVVRLDGELQTDERTHQSTRADLSVTRGQELVADISDAADRAEAAFGCTSTTTTSAYLHWSCDGRESDAEFKTNECNRSAMRFVGGQTSHAEGPTADQPYRRALGLGALGEEVLKEFPKK